MIRNEKEYNEALARLSTDQDFIVRQRASLEQIGLTPAEVNRAMQPAISFHAQLEEEVEWYKRVKERDFEVVHSLTDIGHLLIAARIANGLSQRDLAARLNVSEAQVSRDERNEYHGVTVDRAQRILDVLEERVSTRIEPRERELAPV